MPNVPTLIMRIEVMDAKTCDTCAQLHGATVPVGSPDEYLVRDLAHPNCRREVVEIYPDDLPYEWSDQLYATPSDVRRGLGQLMQAPDMAQALGPRAVAGEAATRLLGYTDPATEDWLLDMAYRGYVPSDPDLAAMVQYIREELGLR